jgi:hypothetical protein
MDRPFIYQIRVQGQLDASWSEWLSGLMITTQSNGETLLTGPIQDQAELHGLIDQLYAMNLALLSVLRMDQVPGIR